VANDNGAPAKKSFEDFRAY